MERPGAQVSGDFDPNRKYVWALALLASLFFMWGFCTVLNDVLVPHLKAVFVMNWLQTMLIQFVFFLGYFLLSIPAALIIERIGYKRSIVAGLCTMAVGCLLFIPASALPSYPVFLGALFVLAGGITMLQVAANPYVTVLGKPETGSFRLNLVQALNSLGTFLAPYFGSIFILGQTKSGTVHAGTVVTAAERIRDAQAVQGPYFGIAVVLGLLAIAIAVFRLPKVSTHPSSPEERADNVWRHPLLLLGVIAIFVYVGAEVTIGSFMTNYITSPRISDMTSAQAGKWVSYYWGGAMVGRFIGSGLLFLFKRLHPAALLAFNAAAAMVLIAISVSTTGHVAMWAMLLVGLFNSIMFPTIFALAVQGLGPLTGRGSGFLIMAIFGGGILPLVQGFMADHVDLRVSYIAPGVCYLFVLYFAVAALRIRHEPASTAAGMPTLH